MVFQETLGQVRHMQVNATISKDPNAPMQSLLSNKKIWHEGIAAREGDIYEVAIRDGTLTEFFGKNLSHNAIELEMSPLPSWQAPAMPTLVSNTLIVCPDSTFLSPVSTLPAQLLHLPLTPFNYTMVFNSLVMLIKSDPFSAVWVLKTLYRRGCELNFLTNIFDNIIGMIVLKMLEERGKRRIKLLAVLRNFEPKMLRRSVKRCLRAAYRD